MQATLPLIHEAVMNYVASQKIANPSYSVVRESISELVTKIARVYTIDGDFADPLPELEGDDLNLARNLEEYFENLTMPEDYDPTGAHTLDPKYLSHMPPSYSLPQGKKTFKVTRNFDQYQAAFTSEEEFINYITLLTKRLYDSYNVWKFFVKKRLLGDYADKAADLMDPSNAVTFAAQTAYTIGTTFKDSSNNIFIAVKEIKNTDYGAGSDLDDAIEGGSVVQLLLLSALAVPTDTSTGEAFVKNVKAVVEDSKYPSEGNSLNGNTVGVPQAGLVLYIKKGVMPSIEVDTIAGAFHEEKLALPVEIKVIDKFETSDADIYALLVDPRGVKYHKDYLNVLEQINAEGDFVNYYLHVTPTLAASRNTFMHVWKKPA